MKEAERIEQIVRKDFRRGRASGIISPQYNLRHQAQLTKQYPNLVFTQIPQLFFQVS